MTIDKALLLDEGRVYGARYFTVQPDFVADVPTWFKSEWDEMIDWCETTYGPTPEDGVFVPGGRWYINNSRFWFREQKDMEWFILRWA